MFDKGSSYHLVISTMNINKASSLLMREQGENAYQVLLGLKQNRQRICVPNITLLLERDINKARYKSSLFLLNAYSCDRQIAPYKPW